MAKRALYGLFRPFVRLQARLSRGMTLGVRAVVTDGAGGVLLVEHTYVPGWWLPGGGVDRGETAEAALARELREEAGIEPIGRPRLVSAHGNERHFRGDHILVYRVESWRRTGTAPIASEIRRAAFFPLSALPEGTTAATRRRLAEVLDGAETSAEW